MLGVAIVGAGRMGQIHARNLVSEGGVRLKFAIDADPAAAAAVARAYGAEVCGLTRALSDPGIEGVIISSPADTHTEVALQALSAGKAVLCEKPLAIGDGSERARAKLSPYADKLLVGFNRRFDENLCALKAALAAQEVGEPTSLHIISHDPAPPAAAYERRSGGMFFDMTIHDFDLARWLLDEEPVRLFALRRRRKAPTGSARAVDEAKVLLETRSGRTAVISNNRSSGYGYDQRVEVFCTAGCLRTRNVEETTLESCDNAGARSAPPKKFFSSRYERAYREEIRHFTRVLRDQCRPVVTVEDGLRASELAEAADLSVRKGQIVSC